MKIFKLFDLNIFTLSFIGGVFLLDRILKTIVRTQITLIPYLLSLDFYPNYRGPFNLFLPPKLIIISFIIVFLFLLFFLFRKKYCLSALLIIIGASSNLFDKILFGYTIDTFNFLNISFFNLADGMILFGAFILIYKIFKKGQ